jgi:uncharacterized membrane protein
VTLSDDEARAQARREAAPAALLVFVIFVVLAFVSMARGWALLGLHWWVWIVMAAPALLLTIDLLLAWRGRGLVRSRKAALVLLAFLVLANLVAVAILVAGLIKTNTHDLSGGELLLNGIAVWAANVTVFGVLFWELDAGGPLARMQDRSRSSPDMSFPQDQGPPGDSNWRPQAWDYLYVSLTNSIAFSPTDTLPLTLRLKATMGLESAIAAFSVLLVVARAVNVIGS